MMQQPFENLQPFEKYLGGKYTYTPYINEIAVMLPPIQTLILSNLINKLYNWNKEAKIYTMYGKEYHFTYDQNDISEKELGLKKSTFRDNIKQLSKYIWFDGNRKKDDEKGYNTTYFKLNLDAIKDLFNEGRKKLGKDIKPPENEIKPTNKSPQRNTFSATKGTNDKYPEHVIKVLNSINDLHYEFIEKKITEIEYKKRINPMMAIIAQSGYKVVNKTNKFELG